MKKYFSVLVIISSIFTGCGISSSPEHFIDVSVDIPINKTAVYAQYMEIEDGDTLTIAGISIAEYTFDSLSVENGKKYLFGQARILDYIPELETLDTNYSEVTISLDKKWTLYQYGNAGSNAYIGFFKKNTDTLEIPTKLFGQFPSFPSNISRNSSYSAYRPANPPGDGDNWGYAAVYREFNSSDMINYGDRFADDKGIYLDCLHMLPGIFELKEKMIIDSHGIVISGDSMRMAITTPEDPSPDHYEYIYETRRRIVDFTEPANIKKLEFYLNDIKANGIRRFW